MSVLAFSATDAPGETPLDVLPVKTTLTGFANAMLTVTTYCNAVRYTDLTPVDPNNEPDWFSALEGNLGKIKSHAENWLNTVGPSVTAVPQAIINYSNTFQGYQSTIIDVLLQIGSNPPTPAQRQDLVELFGALCGELDTQLAHIQTVNTNLIAFNNDLTKDFTPLKTGADSVSNAIKDDKKAIENLNKTIAGLQKTVASLQQQITNDEVVGGLSFFACLVGAVVAVASGGAGVAIIAIGAAGLAVGIGEAVAQSKEVQALQDQIYDDQNTLSAEAKQIVVLNSVELTVEALVNQNELAGAAMSDIITTWSTLRKKTNAVLTALKTAESNIGSILDVGDVNRAGSAWGQLTTFATNLQTALGNVALPSPVSIKSSKAVT